MLLVTNKFTLQSDQKASAVNFNIILGEPS